MPSRRTIQISICVVNDESKIIPAHCHIVFGSARMMLQSKRHRLKTEVIHRCKAYNEHCFTFETPLLGRTMDGTHKWLRVGLNGFHAHSAIWPEPVDGEYDAGRWKRLQKTCKINVKPWRKDGKHILVPLQLMEDASLEGLNIYEWGMRTAIELRQYTNRPIVFKMHPRMYDPKTGKTDYQQHIDHLQVFCKMFPGMHIFPTISYQLGQAQKSMKDAWATITYTSGMAIESVLEGIPTIAVHPGNFTYNMQSNDLAEIENPKMPPRLPWLKELAWKQWTFKEMAQGKPYDEFVRMGILKGKE